MRQNLLPLVALALSLCLSGCNSTNTKPFSTATAAQVDRSHSVYVEGGVLKILSNADEDLLFVYIRPEQVNRHVPSGGGGGMLEDPWQFSSRVFWVDPEEANWRARQDHDKVFGFVFDSRQMTLSLDKGTYAVRQGQFIVITLDQDWRASRVDSGLEALRIFDLPDTRQAHLLSVAGKHYAPL